MTTRGAQAAMDEQLRGAALRLIEIARDEDLGTGDVTTALMADPSVPAEFEIMFKQQGVIAGIAVAPVILAAFSGDITIAWQSEIRDGARITNAPARVGVIRGPLGMVLSAERVFLNFLQRLCGVATLTDRFVQAVEGTNALIFDTRKTVPGWRMLDKYAVRCGGGKNHRTGLYDAVLIKDNHLAGVPTGEVAGVVFEMLNRIDTSRLRPAWIEVEAATLAQMKELCKVVGIDVILLDNFPVEDITRAVEYRDGLGLRGRIELEASGGVNYVSVRAIAETGVERISVGTITHSASAIDISLERV